MARVPDEAIRRNHQLTSGAWRLYEIYCMHRNRDTGRCDPSNALLANEMQCSYTHVSDCKKELIDEGWIRRTGRNSVELLVGDFPPLKVRQMDRKGSANFGKFRTSTSENSELRASELRKIPNSSSENSELRETNPIYEPEKEPEIAAAAGGSAVRVENSSSPTAAEWRDEVCDKRFVEWVISQQGFPRRFVEGVWLVLQRECESRSSESGLLVLPGKGELLDRLNRARREPVQINLMGGGVYELHAHSPPPATSDSSVEELARLQAEYAEAVEQLRQGKA